MSGEPNDEKKTAYLFDIICNSATMREHLDNPLYQVVDFTSDDSNEE